MRNWIASIPASLSPQMRFTWIAFGLLATVAASIAMRNKRRGSDNARLETRGTFFDFDTTAPLSTQDTALKSLISASVDRALSVPGSLVIHVRNGEVSLYGQILARDLQPVIKAVYGVTGVRKLITRLETHTVGEVAPELAHAQRARHPEIPTEVERLDGRPDLDDQLSRFT